MFPLPCRAAFLRKEAFLLYTVFISLSCSFADLRQIGINTIPKAPWDLLPEAESQVVLIFDTEMEKPSVEKAVQILSPNGTAETEPQWKGRELHLTPVSLWMPGIRYCLKLSGTVTAMDGREAVLSEDIPFFAVSSSPLPYVKSVFPPDQSSVGVYGPHGLLGRPLLELNFSRSMDRRSTEAALKFEIPGEKLIEWQDDHRSMLVRSNSPLNPWIVYRWSVTDKALSVEGAPLAKEYSGRFITDEQREFITVVRVLPLMPPEAFNGNSPPSVPSGLWGAWLPAGPDLEQGAGFGHGIGVEFSKNVDSESLARAFSFIPSLPGRIEVLSPVSAVFIPLKEMECETFYEMRISGALKDTDGLKMGSDFTATFKSDIPFLSINSVSFVQGEENYDPETGNLFPVKVTVGGILRCIIHFSLSFDPSVREESAFKISLRPFFPLTLPPVSMRSARWISSDRLLLEWEGPAGGIGDEAHYYKLIIPRGTHNGRGSYLKDDFVLYLEAEHE